MSLIIFPITNTLIGLGFGAVYVFHDQVPIYLWNCGLALGTTISMWAGIFADWKGLSK